LDTLIQGRPSASSETTLLAFANHGCGGTNNIGTQLDFSELSLDETAQYDDVFGHREETYDPYDDRHTPLQSTRALEDILPGQEVFDNYLMYGGKKFWTENLVEFKTLCMGLLALGSVSEYEARKG
jgi:hypothetical protein